MIIPFLSSNIPHGIPAIWYASVTFSHLKFLIINY
jgi:hypothetical protein